MALACYCKTTGDKSLAISTVHDKDATVVLKKKLEFHAVVNDSGIKEKIINSNSTKTVFILIVLLL